MSAETRTSGATALIWHEVECGCFADDLGLWEHLAAEHGDPVLDLGAGAGRVALHLARRGHRVDAVDLDPAMTAALADRARTADVPVHVLTADVRALAPGRRYPLVLAPMQLFHLLGGAEGRTAGLRSVAAALAPGGLAALAIVEAEAAGDAPDGTLPDVREHDGWIYSSLPLGARIHDGQLISRRLRQTVSPSGELSEEVHEDALDHFDAATIMAEAEQAGLEPAGLTSIEESERWADSTVVLLRGEG